MWNGLTANREHLLGEHIESHCAYTQDLLRKHGYLRRRMLQSFESYGEFMQVEFQNDCKPLDFGLPRFQTMDMQLICMHLASAKSVALRQKSRDVVPRFCVSMLDHFLVGGFELFVCFHLLGIIIPADFYFFRGVAIPPTSFPRVFVSFFHVRFNFPPLFPCVPRFHQQKSVPNSHEVWPCGARACDAGGRRFGRDVFSAPGTRFQAEFEEFEAVARFSQNGND